MTLKDKELKELIGYLIEQDIDFQYMESSMIYRSIVITNNIYNEEKLKKLINKYPFIFLDGVLSLTINKIENG